MTRLFALMLLLASLGVYIATIATDPPPGTSRLDDPNNPELPWPNGSPPPSPTPPPSGEVMP